MLKYLLALITMINAVPLYIDYQVQEDYVPILGYHKIGSSTDSVTTTVEHYKDQLDYLTNTMNCNWITMESLSKYVQNSEKIPTNACIINFDDGIATQYHTGLCTLNTHKIPATFYVASSNVDDFSGNYHITWEELDNLHNIGHDLEAHTLTHAHLSTLDYQEQTTEIIQSKVELENRGYNVSTFAYPYGEYNDDTLDILRNSDFILTRDTSQDTRWKDIRVPLVSFNEDNLLHYYYIKPEGLTGSELADKIKYTGWWQFEDNYKLINDNDGDVKVSTSSSITPTDTSYGIVAMYDIEDEISTQFLTKYIGGFTLDILLYNSTLTVGFGVTIDGVSYDVNIYDYTHQNSLKYTIGSYDYYNFYINIPSLSPGVHTINVINTSGKKMYLDKFRLFSNVNQDFQDVVYYKDCDPETDDYCTCSETTTPTPIEITSDPTCEFGILKNNICCLDSCGTCGGTGCSNREGGSSGCCGGTILTNDNSCNDQSAPCVIKEVISQPDPTCEFGILKNNICCVATCGTCGGSGCSDREGGSSGCCGGTILTNDNSCNIQSAPCVVEY